MGAISGLALGPLPEMNFSPSPEVEQQVQQATQGSAPATPAAQPEMQPEPQPHESIARHIVDALGGGNGHPMDWARSILAGGLAGAANVGKVPEGGGFLAGAGRGFQGVVEQKQQQIDFEKQEKLKADERANQELAIHQADAQVQRAMWNAQTAASIAAQQRLAAQFPLEQEEHNLKIKQMSDQIRQSEQDNLAILSAAGVDIQSLEHITSYDQLTDSHAKQIGSGDVFAVPNGEEHKKEEDGAGAYLVPGNIWDEGIKKPVTVTAGWEIDKNGKATPKTITAQEGTMVGTLLAIAKGAQQDLANKQGQILKQANLEAKRSEIDKNEAEAAKDRAAGAALGGATVQDQAKMLVDGTIDPSQLSKRAGSYGATLAAANEYSMQKYGKPFDAAQAQSDYKYANQKSTQDTLKYLNSLTGPDNNSGNLGELIRQSDALTRTHFPPLNDVSAWARLTSGDPAMAAYHATVSEVSDQVAKILQGGGGGATSDAKMKQAQDLFRVGFNKDQIRATAETLRTLLGNRKSELIGHNRYLQRQYETQAQAAGQQPPMFASAPGKPRLMSMDGGKTWQPAQ